jgi:hypothetical protein
MPPLPLNNAEVDSLFRHSENRQTLYGGRDQNPDGVAHALARHYLITNVGLADRRDNEARAGAIAFFGAYITRVDMVAAALELLNGPAGLWAREQLFDIGATRERPRGSHTGMRAVIHNVGQTYRIRYPGGTGVMPVSSCRMYLDRIDERPLKLHIHTFYPTLQVGQGQSWAEVKYRDGRQFSRWP